MKLIFLLLVMSFLAGCQISETTQVSTKETVTESEPVDELEPAPLGFEEGWEYGPIVFNSDELDFLPVDPEAIVLPDGNVRMWVGEACRPVDVNDPSKGTFCASQLRTFTSNDGITFEPEDVPLIKGDFPSVVALANGQFRMYVVRFSPDAGEPRVYSLISSDALNWDEEPGYRFSGQESTAVILKDGRTLLAVRRESTRDPSTWDPLWPDRATAIWFAISEDGLNFEELGEAIDGVDASKENKFDGRTYGPELTYLASGELILNIDGGLAGFFAEINESELKIINIKTSPLRGESVLNAYDFIDQDGQPGDKFRRLPGAGADASMIALNGKDFAYVDLRDRDDEPTPTETDKLKESVDPRQRIVLITRSP